MKRYLEFSSASDHNGYRASVHRLSRGSASVVVSSQLISSAALGDYSKAFVRVMEGMTQELVAATDRYSAQGFRDWATPSIFRSLGNAFRDYRSAALSRRKDLNEMQRQWATPKFANDVSGAPLRAELRGRMANMKPAQAFEAALRNFEIAAAIAEGGAANALSTGWTEDLWGRFIDAFRAQNLANQIASQHQLRLKPTAADVLRDGLDMEAARQSANGHLQAHRVALDEVDAAASMLTSVITFTATTLDTYPDGAFHMLVGA